DRMGKGVRTAPRDALISQSIRERDAGKAFGIHRTLDQLGAVLGPLLAFILIPMVGVRTVFLASFIPALIALIILLIAVAEVATPPKSSRLLPEVSRVLSGKFLWLLLSLSIFNLGAYNFSFILVRASELGVAVLAAPIVYMLMNLTHTAVGIPSGILADRIGREKTLVLAMLMFAFTSLMLAYLSGAWIYGILLALIFGVFQGMYDTVSRAVVPRYVPEELRGSAYGAYYLVIGVSFLLGMSIVGMLWDYVGRTIAFTYSTILSALGATLLYLSVIRKS
ncbi:MAG: MFS transporter, partial [Thermoprotei archaeon]